MSDIYFNKSIKALSKILTEINDEEQCFRFLCELLNESELKSIAKRLEIATLLIQDSFLSDIAIKTGASNGEIRSIKYSIDYGSGEIKKILSETGDKNGKI